MTTSTTTLTTTRTDGSMPIDLAGFLSGVDSALEGVLTIDEGVLGSVDQAESAVGAIRDLVSRGGKRVRPSFVAFGWAANGGDAGSGLPVRLGAAVELLHVSALLHDDVVDGSPTRRGAPTAHVRAATDHRDNVWIGDADSFGTGLAILAGDLAAALADQILGDIPGETLDHWRRMKTEVAIGQILDHSGTARRNRSIESALEVVRLKTSQYTVVRPLLIGASAVTGAIDDDLRNSLTVFATAVGEAFQMRDDVLGTFGDATNTGKPVGTDLREGKPTLLLALAHGRADDRQRSVLDRVGSGDLRDAEIAEIAGVLRATGALAEVEDRITQRTDDAISCLASARVSVEVRDALAEFARSLVGRAS